MLPAVEERSLNHWTTSGSDSFQNKIFFPLNFYLLYLCIRHKYFFLIIKDVNHPAQNIAETRINYL